VLAGCVFAKQGKGTATATNGLLKLLLFHLYALAEQFLKVRVQTEEILELL